jgi:RHS repeat-associated protein
MSARRSDITRSSTSTTTGFRIMKSMQFNLKPPRARTTAPAFIQAATVTLAGLLLGALGSAPAQAQAVGLAAGRYFSQNANSGKCLEVRSASMADGAAVQQAECNGSSAQQFNITSPASGVVVLANANSGKCIDVAGASGDNGAQLQQYTCNGTNAQRFTVTSAGPGHYTLVNLNSGKCIDVPGFNLAAGVQLQQYTCNGSAAQKFSLTWMTAPTVLPALPSSPALVMEHQYDAEGNPTVLTEAPAVAGFHFQTQNTYDKLNRVKDTTDAKAGITKFEYDGQDNLTKVTDPRNLETLSPHNGLGDNVQLQSPDTGPVSHIFDEAGNLKTRLDARGVLSTYTYDGLNRLTRVEHTKAGLPTQVFTWAYDLRGHPYGNGAGHFTRMDYPAGMTQFAYTGQNGRLTEEIQNIYPLAGTNNGLALRVDYEYSAVGDLIGIKYPSGRRLALGYTLGPVNGLVTSLGIAKDGTSTAEPLISQIQYEPFGGPRNWQWHMAAGLTEHSRHLDRAGRPIRYTLGGLVRDLRYDVAGRINSYTHHGLSDGVPQTGYDQSFGYDPLGRLTQVNMSGYSWSADYDANGNRKWTALGGVTNTYTTASTSNRLMGISNPAQAFGYDNAGNTSSDSGKAYTATYNAAGRLMDLHRGNASTTYTYDNFGRRIRKASKLGAASTVLFVYGRDDQLLGEYDSTGKALREYVWLGTTPVAMFTPDPANPTGNPLVYYIHADHLDTPRVVIDKNQGRRWRWLAEPFGASAPETNPEGRGVFAQNLRFPGQYFDQESGLFYNMARYYGPSESRYTQSDPIGLDGGINPYAYGYAQPTKYTDPSGLIVPLAIPGICAAGGCEALIAGALILMTPEARKAVEKALSKSTDHCCIEYKNVYDPNPKHGAASRQVRGGIAPAPVNGQAVLAASVAVSEDQRIGYDYGLGQIVIFRRHHTDEQNCTKYWHGYVVSQQDLRVEQWRAGRDAGFPNWTRKP